MSERTREKKYSCSACSMYVWYVDPIMAMSRLTRSTCRGNQEKSCR